MTDPDPWWDFCDRNDRIVALAALSPGRGRIAEDDDLRQLKTTGATNMSLLTETTKATTTAPSKWAGRVKALGATAPWWETSSVVAVVELEIAGVLRVLAHVGRSQKSGRLFCNAPSARRGEEWIAHYEFVDPELGKVVHVVAVDAAERFLTVGAATQPDADDGEMPF